MCFDCCEVVVCCVNCMNVSINDLPIEIIEDFIFPLLTLKDIKNLGKLGIKRLEDIADKYIADNKSLSIVVTAPITFLPTFGRYDGAAEIIHLRRTRRKKVWSMSTGSGYSSAFAVISNKRSIGGYGSALAYTEVHGTNKSFYHFHDQKDEWIRYSWINIGDTFSIESWKKEDLQRFKSWLTQMYTKKNKGVLSVHSIGDINEIGELLDCAHRNRDIYQDFGDDAISCIYDDLLRKQSTYKESNKPQNKLSGKLSKTLILKAFSKTPTTWILKRIGRESYSYTGYLSSRRYGSINVVKDTSRYIVFRMKDNVYFVGGYVSHNKIKGKKNENDKSCTFEQYNLNEKRWVMCKHSSPYPLDNTSVVVTSDQTCAIFTGGQTNWKRRGEPGDRIIIFEEETGFTLLEDKMLKRHPDSVSILLNEEIIHE